MALPPHSQSMLLIITSLQLYPFITLIPSLPPPFLSVSLLPNYPPCPWFLENKEERLHCPCPPPPPHSLPTPLPPRLPGLKHGVSHAMTSRMPPTDADPYRRLWEPAGRYLGRDASLMDPCQSWLWADKKGFLNTLTPLQQGQGAALIQREGATMRTRGWI